MSIHGLMALSMICGPMSYSCELGLLSAGAGAVAACHYPAGDGVRNAARG